MSLKSKYAREDLIFVIPETIEAYESVAVV